MVPCLLPGADFTSPLLSFLPLKLGEGAEGKHRPSFAPAGLTNKMERKAISPEMARTEFAEDVSSQLEFSVSPGGGGTV